MKTFPKTGDIVTLEAGHLFCIKEPQTPFPIGVIYNDRTHFEVLEVLSDGSVLLKAHGIRTAPKFWAGYATCKVVNL